MVKGNFGLLRDAADRDVDTTGVKIAWVVEVDPTEVEIAWVVGIDVAAWVEVALLRVVAPVFGFLLVPTFPPIQKAAVNSIHTPRILPMSRNPRNFFFTGRDG